MNFLGKVSSSRVLETEKKKYKKKKNFRPLFYLDSVAGSIRKNQNKPCQKILQKKSCFVKSITTFPVRCVTTLSNVN